MNKEILVRNLIFVVILFILAMMAFSYFIGLFESESKKVFKEDLNQLVDLVTQNCENEYLNGQPHTSLYTIKESVVSPLVSLSIDTKLNGSISFNTECKATYILYNEEYKAKKEIDSLLFVNKKEEAKKCTLESETLEIGSTVKCGKEQFYVLEYDEESLTLLSKYNVNVRTNKQDVEDIGVDSVNAVSFDEINNRINPNNTYCERTYYGCNLYTKVEGEFTNGTFTGTINEDSTVKTYVDSYAILLDMEDNLIGASLITTDQLENLGCSTALNDCTNSQYDWLYSSTYWTSSYFAGSPSIVWRVTSEGFLGTSYANYANYTGVRPLIKVNMNILETSK